MTNTEKAWTREFKAAAAAIPAEWIWTDPSDGWQGIDPAHADSPLIRYYQRLSQVGYARGWL